MQHREGEREGEGEGEDGGAAGDAGRDREDDTTASAASAPSQVQEPNVSSPVEQGGGSGNMEEDGRNGVEGEDMIGGLYHELMLIVFFFSSTPEGAEQDGGKKDQWQAWSGQGHTLGSTGRSTVVINSSKEAEAKLRAMAAAERRLGHSRTS